MLQQQSPEKIRAHAQELDDAVERQDIDLILSCFADDCEVEVFGVSFRGKAALQRSIEWMYQDLGQIRFEPIVITVDGDVYFEEFIMQMDPPHAKMSRIKAAEVLIYENYKVKSLRLYIDRLQIGNALAKGFIGRSIIKYLDKISLKELKQIASSVS